MQGSAIVATSDFRVGGVRLRERAILGERDDASENRIVFLEPREVHLSELHRRHALATYELRQFSHRQKRELVEFGGRGTASDLASHHRSPGFDFHLLSGRQGIEHDCRTHRIRQ